MKFLKAFKSFSKGNKIKLISLLFFMGIPILLTGYFVIAALSATFFPLEHDTTNLTNIGFAVFAGIATVCFSWMKAIEKNASIDDTKSILQSGERSFCGAIFFILASGLKYAAIYEQAHFKSAFSVLLILILNIYSMLCFAIAFLLGLWSIMSAIYLLFIRIYPEEKK